MNERYYAAGIGRFLTKDAVLGALNDTQSLNKYAYALGDPVNLKDDGGLYAMPANYSDADPNVQSYSVQRQNSFSKGAAAQKSYTHIEYKVFYNEGEDPSISLLGSKYRINGSKVKTSGLDFELVGLQLISRETGIAKISGEYAYGSWNVNAPHANLDLGVVISPKVKVSAYSKVSLVEFGGSGYIPLPLTRHKLEVGCSIDLFSVGGGLDLNLRENEKRIKLGLHYGIGADLILGIK